MSTKLEELREATKARQAAKAAEIAARAEAEEIHLHEMIAEKGLELAYDVAAVVARNTGKMVIVQRPTRVAHKAFLDRIQKGLDTTALESFLKTVAIYPDQKELQVILDESPGVLTLAANAAVELVGEVDPKKD